MCSITRTTLRWLKGKLLQIVVFIGRTNLYQGSIPVVENFRVYMASPGKYDIGRQTTLCCHGRWHGKFHTESSHFRR